MMQKSKLKKTRLFKSLLVLPISILLIAFTVDFKSEQSIAETPNSINNQTPVEDEIPNGWFESGSNPDGYSIKIESADNTDEKYIVISSENINEKDFGNLMQTFEAKEFVNKRVKFSGKIKTENAKDGAAFWMRVDGDDKTKSLAFDNMQNRKPTGTSGWQNYEIVLDVPGNAKLINIGLMLTKEGKAWFGDLNFEVVDESVPTTSLSRNFPESPVNLNLKK